MPSTEGSSGGAGSATGASSEDSLARLALRLSEALAAGLSLVWLELARLDDSGAVERLRCAPGGAAPQPRARTTRGAYSPGLWPSEGARGRSLDAAFALDRELLAEAPRALLALPLTGGGRELGLLLVASDEPAAFPEPLAPLLAAASTLLALQLEHERAWRLEAVRHARRVRLEAALPALAASLDVRTVFGELSGLIRDVLPHDVLAFALLLPDRSGVRVQAATDQGVLELPVYRYSNDEETLDARWEFLLAYDLTPLDAGRVRARISPRDAPELVEVVTSPGEEWLRFLLQARIRSVLRVPIRSKGRPIGGVVFLARASDAYDAEDGLVAGRVADQLALALAHQELAEEERRIALAEERARLLERRVDQLSGELERFSAHRALGQSGAWRKALGDATQVAGTDATVLITGESGTGKEVIARFLHRGSKRAQGPFVALNCAALPEQLMESELFGHERGAFTGATTARAGKLEQATGGVLFLDEVGEMSPAVQAKFLRVLQEREYQRVGGSRVLTADVRILAATNRDPRAAIARGEFREDLYYRLGVFEIHLPPLRERPEDILVLAEAFLEEVGHGIGRPAAGLSESARELLLAHPWPGNVRELRNAIERAVILCAGGLVAREHLPLALARPAGERAPATGSPPGEVSAESLSHGARERELLLKAMARAANNKSQAARLLGLSRGQLYSLLRRHGLTDARR